MRSILAAHFRVSWLYSVRARALWGIFALGGLALAAGWVAASFSLRQPLVVAVDVGYSGLRILGAFLTIFWVQDMFFRDIDRRMVLSIFAFPISRSSYVLGRFAGIAAVIMFAVAVWAVGLYLLGTFAGWGYAGSSKPVFGSGFIWVMAGFALDLMLIGAFALVVTSMAESALVPIVAGLGFSFIARGLGGVIGYLDLALDLNDPLRVNLLPWLQGLRWVIPDLSRLDLRPTMLYGSPIDFSDFLPMAGAALGYLVLMLLLVIRNYEKREFA